MRPTNSHRSSFTNDLATMTTDSMRAHLSEQHFKYEEGSPLPAFERANVAHLTLSRRTENTCSCKSSPTPGSGDEHIKFRAKSSHDRHNYEISKPLLAMCADSSGITHPTRSTNHGNEFKKAEKMAVTKCMKRSKSVHHRAAVSAVLSRLMRRTYRKNAACAYEKHLSLEIKAAKTVAIVTGCFIFCWLGFSILYGFAIETNPIIWSILFWLGYLNSALNPIIYTLFNREFRMCFKQLLTCNQLIFTQRSTRSRNCTSYSMVLNGTTNRIAGSFSLTSAPIKGTTNIPSSPRSTNTNNDEIIIEEMP
uniref:G-protein coupled receptors family 1 profile domain-containing protein n=1 Tax=Parascaris univalens TaxID=6257 RepID=A0A915C4J7_PARUN